LAKLYETVRKALKERIEGVKLWSDSTIVLGWIRTCPSTLKTFVANRVSQIQTLGLQDDWNYVPSAENPADILSKGTSIEELKINKLWWYGPWWLQEENSWPVQPSALKEVPEKKTVASFLSTARPLELLPHVSSFKRLIRVIAYCCRFIKKCRRKTEVGALTAAEIIRAEEIVANLVQRESFPKEFHCLQTGQPIKRDSILIALNPCLNAKGLICVGGRLRHANISQEAKHPIILPSKHFVTRLLLRNEHVRMHHCGPEQLLASIRQNYWILSGRREARKITRSCLNCFRLRPKGAQVKMGDLPAARVTGYIRPFTISGVDYAGPIKIKERRRRGNALISKAYIVLFICFNTKAVHLELVTDLTSESFLAALRRFTGRRGNCTQLYSDNATNFVGAAKELAALYNFLKEKQETIQTALATQKIEWNFIPPRAPNFGGLWEANIKSMKKHFYAVTQSLILTFEECYTLLVGIEAVLNSRPLTPISDDPQELDALTPFHFLIGERLSQPVEENYLDTPNNRLKQWQHLQKVRQDFWRR